MSPQTDPAECPVQSGILRGALVGSPPPREVSLLCGRRGAACLGLTWGTRSPGEPQWDGPRLAAHRCSRLWPPPVSVCLSVRVLPILNLPPLPFQEAPRVHVCLDSRGSQGPCVPLSASPGRRELLLHSSQYLTAVRAQARAAPEGSQNSQVPPCAPGDLLCGSNLFLPCHTPSPHHVPWPPEGWSQS